MAYDEQLADRIRALAADEPGLGEQKMFGGLAFLVNGNMSDFGSEVHRSMRTPNFRPENTSYSGSQIGSAARTH